MTKPSDQSRRTTQGLPLLVFVGGVALTCIVIGLIIIGRDFVIPIILATVVWYLINVLGSGFQRVPLPAGQMPRPMAMILSLATIFLFFWMIYAVVVSNATAALALFSPANAQEGSLVPREMLADIRAFTDTLPAWLPISLPSDAEILQTVNGFFSDIQQTIGAVWGTTRQAITQVTATATTMGVVLLYLVFIFMEQGTFERKIQALTVTEANYKAWSKTAKEVTDKLNAYVGIKGLMSLLTAGISLVVLLAFNVPFALFWALVVFVLNFIPVVGSIVAWFMPMIVVLLGDYSAVQVLSIGLLLLGAQQLVGSFIEPRIAGDALNISPLVILISLAFWNIVLGVLGLFLAVPLTVLIATILAQFDGTRWIAILLSRDGNVAPGPVKKDKAPTLSVAKLIGNAKGLINKRK